MKTARYNHIIKFIKGHYGYWNTQDELIENFKRLQEHWSGVEGIKEIDILELLLHIFYEHVPMDHMHTIFEELVTRGYGFNCLGWRTIDNKRDLIEFLVQKISNLKVRNNNEVLINLTDNDKEIEELLDLSWEISKN